MCLCIPRGFGLVILLEETGQTSPAFSHHMRHGLPSSIPFHRKKISQWVSSFLMKHETTPRNLLIFALWSGHRGEEKIDQDRCASDFELSLRGERSKGRPRVSALARSR